MSNKTTERGMLAGAAHPLGEIPIGLVSCCSPSHASSTLATLCWAGEGLIGVAMGRSRHGEPVLSVVFGNITK